MLHSNAKFSHQTHFSHVMALRNIDKTVFKKKKNFAVVAHPQSEYRENAHADMLSICVCLLCNFRGLKMGSQAWKAMKEPWSESRFGDERLLYLGGWISPHKVLHRQQQVGERRRIWPQCVEAGWRRKACQHMATLGPGQPRGVDYLAYFSSQLQRWNINGCSSVSDNMGNNFWIITPDLKRGGFNIFLIVFFRLDNIS